MFDVIEVFLLVLNLCLFLLVWQTFKYCCYIHDMVKFFILQKMLKKGVK